MIHVEIEKEYSVDSGISIVVNQEYEKGMFTSLQCGLKQLRNSEWILYHFVDQPGLPDLFYKEFAGQVDDNFNWIQPEYKNKKGHPIVFDKEIFSLITNASAKKNLNNISKHPQVKKKFWKCNYPQVLQDIDTQQDYQKEILIESI
jgi:molybdenum cofactor cytidylyltransferase